MATPLAASLRALQDLLDQRHTTRAINYGDSLAAQSPQDVDLRLAIAQTFARAGMHDAALAHLDAALALDDTRAGTWLAFAEALWRTGQRELALAASGQQLALEPQHAAGWFLRGQILLEENQAGESTDAFARALAIDPQLVEQRFALGQAAMRSRAFDFAAIHFHACVSARPQWLDAHLQLGHALLQRGRFQHAYKIGINAAAMAGDDVRTHVLQAQALEHAHANPAQTLQVRLRIVALQPDSWENQFLLAIVASRAGRYDLTQHALDHTLRLFPEFLPAAWAKFQTPLAPFQVDRASVDAFVEAWDRGITLVEPMALARAADRARIESMLLAQSNFYLGYTAIDVTARQARLGRLISGITEIAFAPWRKPLRRAPRAGRRLRLGFVTSTLRRHTVIKLFGRLMTGLPRDRFEVFAFGIGEETDEVTAQLQEQLDGVTVVHESVTAIAGAIAAEQLDAIVHLDIGMHPRSATIGALRLAPFQAVLWGHPLSTGLDTIDAFLTCAAMEPANGASHYSEQLLPLPHLGCWYDPQPLPVPPLRSERGNERVRLVCAQSGPKLLPLMDELFARILAADQRIELDCLTATPEAALPFLRSRIAETMARHGVDVEARVRVHGHMPEARFLEIAWSADLALDAVGWSGGVTAFETFWGDVPILTLPGEFMRGRHTAAMLELMALPELIATNIDDYVARAVALAADAGERKRLSGLIGERKHRLYRNESVIDAFAELIEREVDSRLG